LKSFAWCHVQESVRQFGAPLREQLDLQSEARNLARFNANFHRSKRVSFPKPIYPLVATDVLVRCRPTLHLALGTMWSCVRQRHDSSMHMGCPRGSDTTAVDVGTDGWPPVA
jgi:ABC1 atypical kinase-like domain